MHRSFALLCAVSGKMNRTHDLVGSRFSRPIAAPISRLPLLLLLAAAGLASLPRLASAQSTYTWDPTGANGASDATGTWFWNTSSPNWYTGGSAGQMWQNATGASANNTDFGAGGTGSYIVTFGAPIDVGLMTFQSMGTGGNYTLSTSSADSLTIYSGITLNSGSGPVTISSTSDPGVLFGAANIWTNSSSSLLTVSSAINDGGFGLTVGGTGNTTISGALGGSGGLTMSGTGTSTLTLSAVNTFSGNTSITSGTLQITGSGSLNSGNYAGTINDAGTFIYNSSASQTLSGAITGAGGLTMSGASTLTLSSATTAYTGATNISSGSTLVLSNTSGFKSSTTIASGGTLNENVTSALVTVPASYSISGTGLLIKSGSGNWTIGASGIHVSMNMTGGTIDIQGGEIQDNFVTAEWTNNKASMNIVSSGIMDMFSDPLNIDALTGSGTVQNGYSPNGVFLLTLGNNNTQNNAAYGVANNTALFTGIIGPTGSDAYGILTDIALTKVGTGTQILTGTNQYTGATTISGGTLELGNGGTTGTLLPSSSITDNGTLAFNRSNAITQGTDFSSAAITGTGGILLTGGGTLTLNAANTYSGGTVVNAGTLTVLGAGTLGSATSPLTVNNPNTGAGTAVVVNLSTTQPTTVGSLSGTIATPSGGANTATINTQTGELFTVNQTTSGTFAGVIAGGAGFTLNSSNGSSLQLNDTPTVNALPTAVALTLGGGTLALQGTATSTTVTQTVGSLTLSTGTSSGITLIDAGSATGTSLTAASFTQSANSTLYLNLANAGTGALTLGSAAPAAFVPWAIVADSTGTAFGSINASSQLVRIATSAALINTSNSATTDYGTNPATDTAANQYSGGTLTLQSGAGATDSLVINAAATGTLALNGQTLSFTQNILGMVGSSNYTISGTGQLGATAAPLTINQSGTGTLTISSLISSGAGSLTKVGNGPLTLTGVNNTYTGGTIVDAGTLTLGPGGQVGVIRGPLTINSGATVSAGAGGTLGWSLGYNNGPSTVTAVSSITLNGGTLNFTSGGDGGTSAAAINMTGGTISGGQFDWYGTNGTTQGYTNTPTLTVNASSTTSTISAPMIIRFEANSATFNVAQGTTPSGIDLLVSGAITTNTDDPNNALSGIIKTGAGTAVFSASNSYTGPTAIQQGTLQIASSVATNTFASPITVSSGAVLQVSSVSNTSVTNTAATINLNGTLSYLSPSNNYFVWNAAVTAASTSIINISPSDSFASSTGGLYLDGGLTGSAPLTINATTNGFGLVLRNPINTYSGNLIVDGTASTTPGVGSGLVVGDQSGNNTGYASLPNADITVNGTMEMGDNASGMGWASGNSSGQTFQMNALNGTGVVVANMSTTGGPFTRTMSVGNANGTGAFSGIIANGTNDTLSFIKNGTGTETLSGANTYSGGTIINGGTLQLNISTATPNVLPSGGAVTMAGSTLGVQGTATSAGTVTQAVGAFTLAANSADTIVLADAGSATGTNLTTGAFTRNAGSTLFLNLANAGTGALTTSNLTSGALLGYAAVTDATGTGFGSVNGSKQIVRFTGGTQLTATSNTSTIDYTTSATDPGYSGGTLLMAAGAHATDSLTINTSNGAGVLDLGGPTDVLSLTQGGLMVTGNNNYTIQDGVVGASGAEIDIHQYSTGTLTINGTVSGGAGTLVKDGPGILILGGTNTYTGLTNIFTGTLRLGSGGTINSGNSLITQSGATFDLNGSSQTLGVLTNGGTVTSSSGTPTLTLGDGSNGAGNFAGSMNVIWNQNTSTTSLTGSWTNTGNITLNGNGAGSITLSGPIGNTGSITNSGTGTTGNIVAWSGSAAVPAATSFLNAAVASSVTGILQNSTTSDMLLGNIGTTYGSGITIQNGTLLVNNSGNGSLGTASNLITLGNSSTTAATLEFGARFGGGTAASWSIANPISVGGTGTNVISVVDFNIALNGPITLNNANLTLAGIYSVTGSTDITATGGVTGTGNITVSIDGTATANEVSFTTAPVNNSGTITYNNAAVNGGTSGTTTATNTITGGVGSNVTAILQNSNFNPLTISTTALNVNSGGTTLTAGGTGLFTVSAPISGTGNLVLNNNNATSSGITLSGSSVNNVGTITNSGTGAGSVLISAPIGTSVTGVNQNSSTSTLILTSDTAGYTGPTTITSGTLEISFNGNANGFASPITVNPGTTLQFTPSGSAQDNTTTATVALNGTMGSPSVITYNAPGNNYNVWWGAVAANGPSKINVSAGGITNAGLYLDGGLTGSAPVTITSNSAGVGVILRTSNSTYSGTLTIMGAENTTPGAGGGLVLGTQGTVTNLPNASIIDNGTIELGNNASGMGWAAGNSSGLTFQMDALSGGGVVVANEAAASSTRVLSVGNNNGTGSFFGTIANGTNDTLSFIKNGTGMETLSGTNTYTGSTTVNAGTLNISAGSLATSSVTVNNSNFLLGGSLTGASVAITGVSSVFTESSTGSIAGTTFTLNSGTATLGGANIYAGSTTVGIGTLRVSNTTGSATGPTGAVTVYSAGTLAGSTVSGQGFISGPVTINAGGTLAGTNGATLTLSGGLTLASQSLSTFNLTGTASANPMVSVSGGSGLVVTSPNIVNFTGTPSSSTATYVVYSTTSPPSLANFTLGVVPGNAGYLLSVSGNKLDLTLSADVIWSGANSNSVTNGNNVWDTAINPIAGGPVQNWVTSGGMPTTASGAAGSGVEFDDTYPTSGTVSSPQSVVVQSGGVTPGTVTFNNNVVTYNISNTGPDTNGISGAAGIAKYGTAPVNLNSPNTFTGAVGIYAGSINLGDTPVAYNGTNYSTALGNANGVSVTASSASLVLNNTSNNPATYGVTAATYNTGSQTTIPLTLSGGGTLQGAGNSTYAGIVTLAPSGGTVATTNSGDQLTLSGTISGVGGLTYSGSGTGSVALAGTNTYLGGTTISSGGKLISTNSSSIGTGTLRFSGSGGTLQLQGATQTVAGLVNSYFLAGTNNIPAPTTAIFATQASIAAAYGGLVPSPGVFLSTNGGFTTYNLGGTGETPAPLQNGFLINDNGNGLNGGNNFAIISTGSINIPTTGSYTFATTSDDGSDLFIDGALVVNNDNFQGAAQRTGAVTLTAGVHSIEIAYFEGGGGYYLSAQGAPTASFTPLTTTAAQSDDLPFSTATGSGAGLNLFTTVVANQAYSNAVVVNAASTLDLGNVQAATFGPLTIGSNQLNIITSGSATGFGARFAEFGATTLSGNPIFDVSGTSNALTLGALNDGGTPRTMTFQDTGTTYLAAAATSLVTGTTVNITGNVWLSASSALGATAQVNLSGTGTLSVGTATQTLSSLNSSATTPTVNIGTGTLTVGSTDNLSSNYAGNLTESAGGTLIQAGTGTLTLTGSGAGIASIGQVVVNGGGLILNSTGALGTLAQVTVNSGSTLTLGANNQISDLTGPGIVALNGNTLTVGNTDNATSTFVGSIADGTPAGGSLAKQGTGTLTLLGTNTYTGGTTISAGTLSVASNTSLGSGTVTLAGGTLQLAPQTSIGIAFARDEGAQFVLAANTAAGVAPMTHWNNTTGATSSASSLVNNSGVVTTASASWSAAGEFAPGLPAGSNGDTQLMNPYLNSSTAINVTLSNIPYSQYEVIAYVGSNGATGRDGSVTVGGTEYFYSTNEGSNSPPFPYSQITNTTSGVFPAGNYTLTTGLTSSSLSLSTTVALFGGFNGIEIINTAPTTSTLSNALSVPSSAQTSTIAVNGNSTDSLGTLAIGTATLATTGDLVGVGLPYTVSVSATTLSGNPTFNVSNNGAGQGTLVLGALNDGGVTARTLTFNGAGATTLNAAATSLITGTQVSLGAGATLNSNASGALGSAAQVSVGSGATFAVGASASQQVATLSGSGSVSLGSTVTVGTSNSDTTTSTFSGTITGAGGLTINKGTGGNLTLVGNTAYTYTGATTINGGTLRMGGIAGTVPTGAAAIYTFNDPADSGNTIVNDGMLGASKNGTLSSNSGPIATVGPAASGGPYGLANAMIISNSQNSSTSAEMLINATTLPSGQPGGIDISNAATGSTGWTASAWFYDIDTNTGIYRTLFRADSNVAGDHEALLNPTSPGLLGMYNNTTGKAGPGFNSSGYTINGSTGGPNITSGWFQLTAVGSGGNTYYYINGTQVGEVVGQESLSDVYAIGNYQGGSQPFAEQISDVYIYQTALNATQITNLYQGTAGPVIGAISLASSVAVGGSGTFDVGGNTVTVPSFSGAGSILLESGQLITGGDNTSTVFTGAISGTGGSLVKNGTGMLTLGGTNSYSGATTVNGGTLYVSAPGSIAGAAVVNNGTLRVDGSLAGAVTIGDQVATHAAFLSGAGTVNGLVTVAGPGLAGGTAGTIVGTSGGLTPLTLAGGLTLGSGSISNFNLTAAGVNNATALISITGSSALTGSGSGTDLVNILGTVASGTYDLYSVATGTVPFSNFQLNTSAPNPFTYTLQSNVSGNQLDLVVTGLLTWTGATNSNWDTSPSDSNWSTGATPAASPYVNGAQVAFGDQSLLTPGTNVPNTSGTATVVIQSTVTPNSITFSNSGTAGSNTGVNYVIQNANGVANGIGGTTGITLTNTGNVTLEGQNSFSGPVNIQQGQLILQANGALGSTSLVTVSSGAALTLNGVSAIAPLTINGAGLSSSPAGALNNASGSNTYSGLITLGSNATINSAASGATLALTGGISIGGSNTLTITGAGNTTVSNTAITGGGGLTYSGSGTGILNLAVANSYGGTTTVNSGALQISNGTSGSATGTGSVMVSGGTLGGFGTISGPVTVSSGGTLAPGLGQAPAGVTSFFGGNLTLNSGTVLDFNLSSGNDNISPSPSNDRIMVSGALSLSGGMINVNDYEGSLQAGNYDLIGYAGSAPSTTGWTFGTVPGYSFGVVASNHQFDLVVTISSGSATWSSDLNTDYGTPGNWQQGAYPNGAGQVATFGLGTQASVTLSSSYTVGQLLFNNSTTNYDLTGGNLTLDNSGSGALVSVASGTATPTILTSLTLADSSHSTTFNVASGTSLDITGTISDSSMVTNQQIVLTGGGTLFMEGNNTYSGGTTIQNGTLSLLGAGVPGTGSLTFNPSSSGNTATVNVNASIGLNNLSETPLSAGSARLNVAASTTLTLTQTASANFAGSVSLGSGGALVVQQNSGNTLTLSGTPTLGSSSSVTVNSGTLSLANSTAASITGNPTVTVAAGATLQLAGSAGALSSSVNITTQGTGASGDGALKLTGTTTQTVGVVSGSSLSVPGITSYAGNTTVGDGTNVANLTATQILQNTLTIGVGSTVTLAPSAPLPMVVAATSSTAPAASASPLTASSDATTGDASDPLLAIQAAIASGSITSAAGQQMENRIAALESLATRDPALNVSLLESRILATLPSSSLWSSTETSPLVDTGSSLLALDGSTFGTTSASSSAGAAFAPSAGFSASPASVPEPSTLLLAALGGIGLIVAARRRAISRN